jgi:hypothetical protein
VVHIYYLPVFWVSLVSGWGKHGPSPSFLSLVIILLSYVSKPSLYIILIGFIIWLVALILQIIAFFTLPTETPQQEPVGP